MRIRAFRVRPVNLTPVSPMETASGVMHTTPLVLLDIETDEGVTGTSYLRCYTPAALEPLAQLVRNLQDVVAGQSAVPGDIDVYLRAHFRLLGAQGLAGMAMAGIDMALWDACAKAKGVPLVRLLGAAARPVPAYASLRNMSARAAADEAEKLVACGFRAIKVKLGRGDLDADIETIRAIRSAVGETGDLMVDYNQSLSVAEALARVLALDSGRLYWIEEPTLAEAFAGHARIAASTSIPIQLDENCWGPPDIEKCIAARASDHLMFDAMKIGGVTGWLRAAALAQGAQLAVSSHTFPEFSAHALCATPTGLWLEYLDHAGPLQEGPIRVADGHAIISERPGSGIEWNERAIAAATA